MFHKLNLTELIKGDDTNPELIYAERIQAFLCATEYAEYDDSNQTFFVSSIFPAQTGKHPVYYIHDDDWGLHPQFESVEAMEEYGLDGDKMKDDECYKFANPLEDPEILFFRSEWLLNAFLMLFHGYTIDGWNELKAAPAFTDFEAERKSMDKYPHLAVYWLWAHALLGNEEALVETIKLCDKSANPVVKESIFLISNLIADNQTPITDGYGNFTSFVRPLLPQQLLSDKAIKDRKEANKKAATAVSKEEKDALKILKAAAKLEPVVKEALDRLKIIDAGQHQDSFSKLNDIYALEKFAEALDERYIHLITGRIGRSHGVNDSDPKALRGMVLSWAVLSQSFEEFKMLVTDEYKKNFGPFRLKEYYFALTKIDDAAAIRELITYAKPYAVKKEQDCEVPFRILLTHIPDKFQSVEGFDNLLADFLNGMDYHPQPGESAGYDIQTAIEAAIVCGDIGCKKAAQGIANLIQHTSNNPDYSRFKAMLALFKISGNQHLKMITEIYESACAKPLMSKQSDDIAKYTFSLISYESILFAMNPENTEMQQRIQQRVDELIAPGLTLSSTDLFSLASVIRVAQAGQLNMLKDTISKIARAKLQVLYEYMNEQAEQVQSLAREFAG